MHYMHSIKRDAGEPGSGGGQSDPSTNQGDPQKGLQKLIRRQGGADAAAVLLYQENYQHRNRIRELEQQVQALTGKVPGEGSVVLDKDQAALWQAYQELGKPDDIKKLKSDFTVTQRNELYRKAAEAHGLKATVLGQLPGVGELAIEVREVEKDGKKAPVAYVKGSDGKEAALPDYAKANWGDFLPALQAEPSQAGTPFPRQGSGATPPPSDKVAEYIQQRDKANAAKPNPLMPKTAVQQ